MTVSNTTMEEFKTHISHTDVSTASVQFVLCVALCSGFCECEEIA